MFSFFQFPWVRVLLIGVLCQNVLCFGSQSSSEPWPRVGGSRQTLVKKVIWVGDSNLGKLEKELVIMMFCAGSLNTPAPIPDSYSCSQSSLNLRCLGYCWHAGSSLPDLRGPHITGCYYCLQFTQNIFAGVEFWKVYGEYMCGNNPPGIIHLMIAGFWPSCSWEPGPTGKEPPNI